MFYENEKITFLGADALGSVNALPLCSPPTVTGRGCPKACNGKEFICSLSLCRIEEDHELIDYLTEHEKEIYLSLGCQKRRQEWFSARIGLKKILLEEGVIELPTQCSIEKDPYGRPYIALQETSKTAARIAYHDCSISHKGGYSIVAVAMCPRIKIGVDIEAISERLYRLRGAFVNKVDSIESLTVDNAKLCTVLWACKEAASKVIGLGISADFKSLVVKEHGNKNRVGVLGHNPRVDVSWEERQNITGSFFTWRGFIIAVCYALPNFHVGTPYGNNEGMEKLWGKY